MPNNQPICDPSQPLDYSKPETPSNYVCSECGASGVKLWREYQTFLNHQTLRCAPCAAKIEHKNISDIDAYGRRTIDQFGGRTDTIGWYVPAVPTEENDSFWGYTSVPEAGCDWWAKLPTLPAA